MDEKEIRDDDNTVKKLDENGLEDVEYENDEDAFESGRENVFESEEEADVFEVSQEMDEFEDEMEDDFDDEMAYTATGGKKGVFSKLFKKPYVSAGWIGVLLVILILVFLFIPRGNRRSGNSDMLAVNLRLQNIEEKMIILESLSKRIDLLSADSQNQKKLDNRLSRLEKNLVDVSNQFQREVENLKKKTVSVKTPSVIKIPETKQAAKQTEVKYHVVQKGENIYRIALRYGMTEAQLLTLNNLKPKSVIYPGQRLKVK